MLRRRAHAGRFEPDPRRPERGHLSVAAVLVGLGLALSGCGGSGGPDGGSEGTQTAVGAAAAEPDAATRECRREWRDLGEEISGREASTHPSSLPQRWTNVTATISYYAAAATEDDCGKALAAQQRAIATLTAFSRRLAPHDMQRRLDLVREDARTYAAGPRPPAPDSKGAGSKKKGARRLPAPKEVAAALRTLARQAPRATDQQRPAWRQAQVVDLADDAAVKRAVKDLAFLSSESAAYRAARSSLGTIREALGAAG